MIPEYYQPIILLILSAPPVYSDWKTKTIANKHLVLIALAAITSLLIMFYNQDVTSLTQRLAAAALLYIAFNYLKKLGQVGQGDYEYIILTTFALPPLTSIITFLGTFPVLFAGLRSKIIQNKGAPFIPAHWIALLITTLGGIIFYGR